VKVQFHWDREGKKDANSSCWVRVATFWAGKQWGAIHIPRIGQEVVVAFEEGDPDQPIVVGSVYNAENMPPETLPDDKTISGIKSRSSTQGDETMYNQLMFEDKKGAEYIYFHAQKDFHRVVENDDFLTVGFDAMSKGDQTIDIHNSQMITIGAPSEGTNPTAGDQDVYVWNDRVIVVGNGETDATDGSDYLMVWKNQELTVGSGEGQQSDGSQIVSIWKNHHLTVGAGEGASGDGSQFVSVYKDRHTTIKTGDDKMIIEKGSRETTISKGSDKLTISMGDQVTKVALGASKLEAMKSIELKVGGNSIKIDQTGITLKGIMIKIEGQGITEMKGAMTKVSGDAMLMCKGGLTMVN
jgi:type VI secretion system secreted protein VgrG